MMMSAHMKTEEGFRFSSKEEYERAIELLVRKSDFDEDEYESLLDEYVNFVSTRVDG